MVAIGTGARTLDRKPDPERRLEHRDGQCRLGRLRAGAPGPGRGDDAHRRRCRGDSRARCAGIRYLSPDAEHAVADHRRDRRTGTRRCRAPSEELPAIRSWPLQFGSFFTAQEVRERGEGRRARVGDARSAVRRRRRSRRRDRAHQQPAVPGHRRADEQGAGGDGAGPGRHGHRALHDRAEASCSACSTSAASRSRRRTACALDAVHRELAARAPRARIGWTTAKTTTSWCARRRR